MWVNILLYKVEQWTVRGWPNGIAIFHKHGCRCCNDCVAHIICACREQSIDLPLQAVSNTVTTVWPMLMRDLKSEAKTQALKEYKEHTDKAAGLRSALESCQDTLASEHGRIERWDDKIRNWKDNIVALKQP
jgi:hypothetical protein